MTKIERYWMFSKIFVYLPKAMYEMVLRKFKARISRCLLVPLTESSGTFLNNGRDLERCPGVRRAV